MSSDLRQEIYQNLSLKDTDELLEIWQENDRVEWSDITFDVIREILQKRLVELPPQGEPIYEYAEEDEGPGDSAPMVNENPPEFYKPDDVVWMSKWIGPAAIAALIGSILYSMLELPRWQTMMLSYMMGKPGAVFWSWIMAVVSLLLQAGLNVIIIYVPLKALGAILKILMEMEINSRVATKELE